MVQLAEALHGELPGPPVQGPVRLQLEPRGGVPRPVARARGLKREDLFTVVHEQFQTDTADYADILLPATTQLEHFDIHGAYGHLYVQANNPAIAPLGEAKPNTEVFRLLARAMGFEPSCSRSATRSWPGKPSTARAATASQTAIRSPPRVRRHHAGAAAGERAGATQPAGRTTPRSPRATSPRRRASANFTARARPPQGRDPLPHYIPPHEDPQTKPDLAAKYPLQLLTPPAPSFLNSTFVNVDVAAQAAGEPTVEIHPDDAAKPQHRRRPAGARLQRPRPLPARAARRRHGEAGRGRVPRPSGGASTSATASNCNATTSTALTDLGGGATFFDNLVEVEPGVRSSGVKESVRTLPIPDG